MTRLFGSVSTPSADIWLGVGLTLEVMTVGTANMPRNFIEGFNLVRRQFENIYA